jgi:hypothetical protein
MTLDAQRRQELIDRFARRLAGLGMTAPAILFLEMHKPLAFLGAQLLWAAQPFLNIAFDPDDVRDFTTIIEDRAGIEQLIDRLESVKA